MNPPQLLAWIAAGFLATVLFSHTVTLRLVLLLLGILCAALAIAKDRNSLRILPPIWLPFLLWATWAALSLIWSVEPEVSKKEFRNEVLYSGLALWICYLGSQAPNAARVIFTLFGSGALLVCAVALYYFSQGVLPYTHGRHGGPGNMSSTVLVLMPCAVLTAWYGGSAGWSWRWQWPAWMLVALLFVAAYTTLNRTVWLALAAQFVIIALMAGRPRSGMASDVRARAMGTCMAFAVILGGIAMSWHIQAERLAAGSVQELEHDPRLAMWPEAMSQAAEQPVFGYGMGRGLLRKELRQEVNMAIAWHSHSLFLDMVLQLGVPGLAMLLVLIGSTLWQGWRLTRSADAAAAACGIALIAVVVGMVMRNITDVLWVRQNALLYWGVVGVLLAWGEARSGRHPRRGSPGGG